MASWLKRKPGTPELSLERPLFDTEVYVNGEKKVTGSFKPSGLFPPALQK
ncbi:hypothetical protein ACK2GW_21730 [Escherichia coli]